MILESNNEFKVMYHGTDSEGLKGIIESKYIGHEYFDGYGVYLSPYKGEAFMFGPYVIEISVLDMALERDDVNDGYYHRGKIVFESLKKHPIIHLDKYSPKLKRDIIKYISELAGITLP